MRITLKRDWEMEDTSQEGKKKVIQTGEYEVERIQHENKPWLVISGTTIGMPETAIVQWQGPKWGDYQIIFKEE
ncbi:hypothetical protein HON36_00420 [Candidatus Parcubacteria bacterium]|jgi:hypothetical protein|nr:hypothetical protein [Candidatus Parcubacteria bacterium]MBT7228332.1 hypothetical protein [Candidatus Parcubacteria bacterium]